jgi:hypothetical protein
MFNIDEGEDLLRLSEPQKDEIYSLAAAGGAAAGPWAETEHTNRDATRKNPKHALEAPMIAQQ